MHVDFTASGIICHPTEEKALLIFHRKLQKRMQAGGHIEEGELPHETALREAQEETGLECVLHTYRHSKVFINAETVLPSPLLVERQSIPAYKETPEHIHCDSFYILTPLSTQYKTDDDGVEDIRWFSIDEINALGDQCFPLLPRIIEKVFTTMRKI